MVRMALEKALRWIVLGSVFALPFIVFIVTQSLYFPFITGKNFSFRIIVEVMTGAWLVLAVMNPAYRPRRSWLLAAFAIFLIVIAAADLFGVNPFKSFWSNFERMDGWVTLAHLFLYFVVGSTMLSTEKLWTRFFQTSLGVSVLVGIHALLQLFGIVSLNPGFSSAARLDATFGNPIYLAVYMLFHIFIAALLFAQLWRENGPRIRTSSAFLYGGIILFNTLVLFLTGTRGAILGLVGGIIFAALLFIFSGAPPHARKIAVGLILLITVVGGAIYVVRDEPWMRNAPIIGRLATISVTEQTAQARIMNWGTAWQGVKERPLLGWGQENFAIVFNKYYNPNMYGQEQWFDRVHNVIFDWLVAGGFLGLLAYLSLFGFALFYIWRKKSGISAFTVPEQSILAGLLAAYFFHNLFVFDNIMSYVLFVSVLAYITFRAGVATNAERLFFNISVSARMFPVAAIVAVALVWGAAWFVNAKPLAANRILLQSLVPQSEGILKNLEYLEKSISYGSFGTQEAREQLLQAAVQVARIEAVPIEIKQQFLRMAAQEMSLQAQRSPLDPRFPLFLGSLLNMYGFYAEAASALAEARALSPTKQTILFEVATNAFARGDIEEALKILKEAFELAPEFTDARIYYATAAIRAKQFALADELLTPMMSSGQAADPRIAAAYTMQNRYDKMIPIWEARIQASPEDVEARFVLAAAYARTGNVRKAKEHIEAAAKIDPNMKDRADELLKEIGM